MTDQQRTFTFASEQPERLDKFLVACLPEFSRSRLQAWIKDGRVTVDGVPAQKTGQQLEGGAEIHIEIPPARPSHIEPEAIPLNVIYEDENLLVVDKPAGMVVHPSAGHHTGTLVHAALAYAPDIEGVGGVQRPGVVHRLDKETSGLILLAKNDRAHRWLQNQFRNREVQKTYLALVDGSPPTPQGRVEVAVGRGTRDPKSMAPVPPGRGRAAASEYFTRETFAEHTLLEVHPVTGRTHQIRVHLAFIGCPVAGDTTYGRRHPSIPLGRHFLHASRLSIRLPGKKVAATFEAPLPGELRKVLDRLRARSSTRSPTWKPST